MRLKRKEAETMSQDENHLTEERLKQLIAESPEWAVGGLLSVYKNQTKDEQEIKAYYSGYEEIKSADIKFSPFWVRRAPTLMDHIEIKIVE